LSDLLALRTPATIGYRIKSSCDFCKQAWRTHLLFAKRLQYRVVMKLYIRGTSAPIAAQTSRRPGMTKMP
jgi:hypothetical protein